MSDSEKRRAARVAYAEDADDDGNVPEDAPRTAASIAPSSPRKEKPNTRKSRKSPASPLARSESSSVSSEEVGAPLAPQVPGESSVRRRDFSKAHKRVSIEPRPAPRHTKTVPPPHSTRRSSYRDEAAYYGQDYVREHEPVITPGVTRPRSRTSAPNPAHRHSSYHGPPSRPPLSNQRYHHVQPSIMTAPPPQSFPPPPWNMSPLGPPPPLMQHGYAPPPLPPPPPPHPGQDFYPDPRSLSSRFERGSVDRPMSAMAHRPRYYADEYEQENRPVAITRRPSTKKKRDEEDRITMPPPPRPSSARPCGPLSIRTSFVAPVPPPRDSTPVYDDHNPFDPVDIVPYYDHAQPQLSRRNRRTSVDHSNISYEQPSYRTEVATTSRRSSQYGPGSSATQAVNDKMRAAVEYQDPDPVPLTTDALRKTSKSKHGGSSRSTRSSASRDESDYRHSATTRTSVDDDMTIRVKGQATLRLQGGAELHCTEGAEINFGSRGVGAGGSDRSSYIDADERRGDDRRARSERQGARIRAASQAGSYSRTPYDQYDGGADLQGYNLPPLPPPPLSQSPYSVSPFSAREYRQYSYFNQ